MIGKRGKATLLLYMIFLAVLFLMCSTDLIIREPEKEIYQIAVIIEDSRDDNYGSFRKGMDQAALELNADVRFFTLYEKLDADQQMELIGREQQDGADALIVVPADEDRVVDALAGHQVTVPMVLLGSGLTGEGVTGTVVVDYGKMGELLGQKMAEHMDEHRTVLVFSDPSAQSGASRRFLEGARTVMEEEGILCRLVVRDGEQGFKPFTESLDAEGQVLILAESPEILAETAGILALVRSRQTTRGSWRSFRTFPAGYLSMAGAVPFLSSIIWTGGLSGDSASPMSSASDISAWVWQWKPWRPRGQDLLRSWIPGISKKTI